MITDDKVLEIEHYCQEHNVSRISKLKELAFPKGNFIGAKGVCNFRVQAQKVVMLRTSQGTAMRIQGSMTPEQLREIMSIL